MEMRRKLGMTVEKHKKTLQEELARAEKRLARREFALMSEPIDFQRVVEPAEEDSQEVRSVRPTWIDD